MTEGPLFMEPTEGIQMPPILEAALQAGDDVDLVHGPYPGYSRDVLAERGQAYNDIATALINAAETQHTHTADSAPPPDPLPAQAPPPPAAAPPAPIAAGTYAVYEDGAGGFVLVLGAADGQTYRHHVPAGMVKMAARFGGINLGSLFGGGS